MTSQHVVKPVITCDRSRVNSVTDLLEEVTRSHHNDDGAVVNETVYDRIARLLGTGDAP